MRTVTITEMLTFMFLNRLILETAPGDGGHQFTNIWQQSTDWI